MAQTNIYAGDFYHGTDLSMFIQKSLDRSDYLMVHFDGKTVYLDQSLESAADWFTYLNPAAETLIRAIKNDCDEETIVKVLSEQKDGLAFRGRITFNKIFRNIEFAALINYKAANPKNEIPVFEINGEKIIIPWDWLYDSEIDRNLSFDQFLQKFWGFNKIVARFNEKGTLIPKMIPAKPRIAFVYDPNLKYALEELKWFEQQHQLGKIRLSVYKPDPDEVDSLAFTVSLNEFLNGTFDILHFACHAEPSDPQNSKLPFLRLGKFKYQTDFLFYDPTVKMDNNPLIFFNACSTSMRSPRETFGFVSSFKKLSVSNIIALDSLVESQVAKQFAEYFYEYFIEGKNPLGFALYKAKQSVLSNGQTNKSIVSLFYSLYGDPWLIVGDHISEN